MNNQPLPVEINATTNDLAAAGRCLRWALAQPGATEETAWLAALDRTDRETVRVVIVQVVQNARALGVPLREMVGA